MRTLYGPSAALVLPAALLVALLLPLASFAYEIGHSEVTWIDPDRGDRAVPAHVYYPADSSGQDVPVAMAPQEGFPVLAFGHGFLMSSQLYGFVWEALVPDGYVVILPETETGLLPPPDHLDFGRDLAFLVHRLAELGQEAGSPFFGRISLASAVVGHSMGGGAALLAAAENPDIDTVIGLAPAETNPSAITAAAQITSPALLVSGSVDCVAPAADMQLPMFEALAGDCHAWVEMIGASHCQFAASSTACNLGEGLAGCPSPSLSRAEQQDLVIQMLRPWLEATLRDEPAAWNSFVQTVDGAPELNGEIECDTSSPAPLPGPARALLKAYPNPFNPGTTIRFELAEPAAVRLDIHDLQGHLVRRLVQERRSAGKHTVPWNGQDEEGRNLGSGVYLLRLQAGQEGRRSKLILLK